MMGFLLCLLGYCLGVAVPQQYYTITYNPYANVNWLSATRCVSQHHDHVRVNESRIRAYDEAGYNAVSIMHYSGRHSLPYAWTERHWPLSDWLPAYETDAEFLATCQNLKILIPSAEEVGAHHITSPFLTEYIALWEPEHHKTREWWHYDDTQGCVALINENGGLAFIAHPWDDPVSQYVELSGYAGLEVYTAYAAYRYLYGDWTWDRNERLLEVWDAVLAERPRTWGIAVNDWYGPFWDGGQLYPDVADSGKIVVMVQDETLLAYEDAIRAGAFFAVVDMGIIKGLCPTISRIAVSRGAIELTTDGAADWISGGITVATGATLSLSKLPAGLGYVRAVVSNEHGRVYVQPFTLNGGPFGIEG